ncbi:MAG: hypothetical protein KatS3mg003_1924 [Candidatus Nitrosocaldaceae archaeon]|nr:MAG: hypothetical protein KatS3mg003_1924 [Candidatus Nitrosocaldaceae archaeon]
MLINRIEEYLVSNIREGKCAVTLGVFCRIIDKQDKVLLRLRKEKSSIINKDLSCKYELIGGGLKIEDISEDYHHALVTRLEKEIRAEAGINVTLDKIIWVAFLTTRKTLQKGIIDLALMTDIDFTICEITKIYEEMIDDKSLVWVDRNKINVPIIGKRMEEMIRYPRLKSDINYYSNI